MTCTSAPNAPGNDLKLYQNMLRYESLNPSVSQSAIQAFNRHLWYLTAEMVPLALFSTEVPIAERRAVAVSLLNVKPDGSVTSPQNRFGTGFGKPNFPTDITLSTTLADLVGEDSWFLFHTLQLDPAFLELDVEAWPDSEAYQSALTNIGALNVINDCAERGVKLSSDFLEAAKTETHYQNALQVVELDRRSTPNLRKRKAKKDS